MNRISVITSYYGAPQSVIDKHITAVLNASYPVHEFILINDGHDNDLRQALNAFRGLIPIVYAKITPDIPFNMGGAANLGIWLSSGDLISLEDCDIIPDLIYYEKAVEKLNEGYDRFFAHYKNESGQPAGCSVSRKAIYTDIGGFDEDFAGNYGWDDIYAGHKFHAKGIKSYVSELQLLTWDIDGETKGVVRDNAHNYKKMMNKIEAGMRNTVNKLRFNFEVTRI